jgi:chromosome segregation ATPase
MAISRKFWVRLIIIVVVAGTAVYIKMDFNRQDSMRLRLNDLLKVTVDEKEQLQSTILSMESQLKDKEEQLASLRDVQSIRQSLANAQTTIENINKEMERVNRERAALQDINLSMTGRLQNTTKEYMRTVEELKKAKEDIARLSKELSPDKKRMDQSAKLLESKTAALAKVQADFAGQQKEYDALLVNNKSLERKIKELETEKKTLSGKMRDMDVDLSKQGSPVKAMRDTIDELKVQLSRKENQIKVLEAELAKADQTAAVSTKAGQAPVVREAGVSQDVQLKQQLSKLIDQLNDARQEMNNLRKAQERSPESAQQDKRLSDILVKKELELETTRKNALDAKENIVALQSRIATLENTIAARHQTQDRIKELESERLALESKLLDLQSSFGKKNELAQNLQQNVDFLNQQLALRDKEKQALESKLAGLDTDTKQDLEKEKARYAEINTLYNSLKTQIAQFSDTLNAKTAELEQRNKDIYSLREELTSLKSKSMIMENELAETRDRQRKTLDDLIAAVRLNSILQERIASGASVPYATMDDKQKADEIRRKVEVILEAPKEQ